jgi:hypothetical protein
MQWDGGAGGRRELRGRRTRGRPKLGDGTGSRSPATVTRCSWVHHLLSPLAEVVAVELLGRQGRSTSRRRFAAAAIA